MANLVPPYERGGNFHGTSAALEFAVNFLKARRCLRFPPPSFPVFSSSFLSSVFSPEILLNFSFNS